MSSIMSSRTPHEYSSSSSFSRRHFDWIIAKLGRGDEVYSKRHGGVPEAEEEDDEEEFLACSPFGSSRYTDDARDDGDAAAETSQSSKKKKKKKKSAISRLRSAVSAAIAGGPRPRPPALGRRVTGTLYGCRGGHMHFAVQAEPGARPAMLVELAASTGELVREMASGLVRIALECEAGDGERRRGMLLVEERLWWAYCNGRKCGQAVQREAGPADWRVLRAVERVTMGAGVLPADQEEEVMYMRARFERVVGSKDSEAFYMVNPENINGGPELTIYLLRV